jgi:nitrate/nitrite-specific signal transduction histidine kinase
VAIRVRQAGPRTSITVLDDGLGFDPGDPCPEGHLGLQILRDTIHQAGGTLEVRSAPGAGTAVTATFAEAVRHSAGPAGLLPGR